MFSVIIIIYYLFSPFQLCKEQEKTLGQGYQQTTVVDLLQLVTTMNGDVSFFTFLEIKKKIAVCWDHLFLYFCPHFLFVCLFQHPLLLF